MKFNFNLNLVCVVFLLVLPLALAAPTSTPLAAHLDVTVTAPGPTVTVVTAATTVTIVTPKPTTTTVGLLVPTTYTITDDYEHRCIKTYKIQLPNLEHATKTIDECAPLQQRTCPRDATAALAIWRHSCMKSGNKVRYPICYTNAPSIDMCCTEWIPNDKPKYQHLGIYHLRETETNRWDEEAGQWIKLFNGTEQREMRTVNGSQTEYIKIIYPGRLDYKMSGPCKAFAPSNDNLYLAFHQNLEIYGLTDCNEKGEVWSEDSKTLLGYAL